MSLIVEYRDRYDNYLQQIASDLERHVKDNLIDAKRVERVSARAKTVEKFIEKASSKVDGVPKYSDPIKQIQDQIGVRVITYYKKDVALIENILTDYYTYIETQEIIPDSSKEFDYFGKHLIFFIPNELIDEHTDTSKTPKFFELQIKTLFQHAWSEANHDLGYKPSHKLSINDKRKIALTSAHAWGADEIFNDLFTKLN